MLFLRGPYGEEKVFALVPPVRSREHSHPGGTDAGSPGIAHVPAAPHKTGARVEPSCRSYDHKFVAIETKDEIYAPDAPDQHEYCEEKLHETTVLRRNGEKLGHAQYEPCDSYIHTANTVSKPTTMNGSTNGMNGSLDVHMNGTSGHRLARQPSTSSIATTRSNGSQRPAHRRKQSQPLAPPFIISAPGKVIVYGEHAVVHGKAAIAAAISLRSYLLVTTLTKSKRTVTLRFPDIGLDHTWNIHDLPWAAFSHPSRKKKYFDLVTSLNKELVDALQPCIDPISPDAKTEKRKIHQAAASSFLYLFLSLGSEQSSACIYTLRSAIPVGVGLGSSASISVCISTALLIQCRALSGPHPDQMSKESEEQLERINRWAFVGEMLIHGNPSGVDNTVVTNGRAVLFQRKDYTKPPSVMIMRDFPELPLLLVDTCQPKSTAAEVAKVGRLKEMHPAVTEHILDSIDSITRSVHEAISDEDFDPESPESIQHLGELMSVNHGLLTALGVSHPKLERLKYLVEQAGVGWTKLTGAGGGGCAITLLKPTKVQGSQLNGDAAYGCSKEQTAMSQLEKQLETEGFAKYETTLGGDGVGVLYPAIINDEEIDQEIFLTVEGREGIEELVGGKHDSEAWKYWRP